MVFPTKLRRCAAKDDSDIDPTSGIQRPTATAEPRMTSTGQAQAPAASRLQPHPVVGKLLTLSASQTKDFHFPVGCPVWYNFFQSSGAPMDVREGYVDSISLDILSKNLIFNVGRKNDTDGLPLIDTVYEENIAYAANCPVVLSSTDSGASKKFDGEVMFAKLVKGLRGNEISYVVKHAAETNGVIRIEDGVKADRLKYRETGLQAILKNHDGEQGSKRSVKNVVPLSSPSASDDENTKGVTDPSDIMSVKDGVGTKRFKKARDLSLQKKPSKAHSESSNSRSIPEIKLDVKHIRENQVNKIQQQQIPCHPKLRRGLSALRSYEHVVGDQRQEGAPDRKDKGSVADLSSVHHNEAIKRKAEMMARWEKPHSWHENDGAI